MLHAWHVLCALTYFVIIYDRTRPLAATPLAPNDGVAWRQVRAIGSYTTRFDHINVDQILQSKRLLKNYFDCVMDRGPCTREGVELKTVLPDALQTECAKCSEIQKKQAGKILAHFLQNDTDLWDELLNKYDTDGSLRKKYGYNEDYNADEDYEERR